MAEIWDTVVVGAGPGGSASAATLAKAGLRVLLIDRTNSNETHPRACGGVLSALAVDCLDELDVLSLLPNQPLTFVTLTRRGDKEREARPEEIGRSLAIADRALLDELLVRHATLCGAVYMPGTTVLALASVDARCIIDVDRDGEVRRLYARFVVMASGTESLGERTSEDRVGGGFAYTARITGMTVATETIEVFAPTLLGANSRRPSWGWLAPTGPASAQVSLGVLGDQHDSDTRGTFDDFVRWLMTRTNTADQAVISKGPFGGRLRCDFAPERCADENVLFVGSAAGLSSPFTGEGIGFALESGRLAANAIANGLHQGGPSSEARSVGGAYIATMRSRYVGYFETGRHGRRRYRLTCRVLDATMMDESPLYRAARQTTLFPELAGRQQPTLPNHGKMAGILGDLFPSVASVVANTNTVLLDTVRSEWPFIARWLLARSSEELALPRPALLLAVAACAGEKSDPALPLMGAAIELGVTAALATLSVEDHVAGPDEIDWANMVATLAVDFLSTAAVRLAAMVGLEFSAMLRSWTSRLSEARCKQIAQRSANTETANGHQNRARAEDGPALSESFPSLLYRSLIELPCEAGALAAAADGAHTEALRHWARTIADSARAYDDVLLLRGRASRLGATAQFSLQRGLSLLDPANDNVEHDGPIAARAREGRAAFRHAQLIASNQFSGSLQRVLTSMAPVVFEPDPAIDLLADTSEAPPRPELVLLSQNDRKDNE